MHWWFIMCGRLLNASASVYTYHIRWLMATGLVHFHKAQNWTLCFLGVTEQNKKNYSSFHGILDIAAKRSSSVFRILQSIHSHTPKSRHLVPRLIMSGAMPPLPLFALMTSVRITSPPSFADIMTPVQPPVIDSSMWTQRYWRHWKGSGKTGYFTSLNL